MKADFEKGKKICSNCRKELPIEMFGVDKSRSDNLCCYCKQCEKERNKQSRDNNKDSIKSYRDKKYNTFGRTGKRWNMEGVNNDY